MPEAPRHPTVFALSQVALAPERLIDVTTTIQAGTTAVLGASGAGKTSLLNLLAEFEKPSRGTIDRPSSVFWVPQDGGLWPSMTVHEHLAAMTRDETAIRTILEEFELGECVKQTPSTLSRGQQARLAVARALQADVGALVMDEPLAHIDTNRRSPFWETIRNSISRRNQSHIFATHEPELVLGEAEHVICIAAGRVVFNGSVKNLYWNPESLEHALFLGPVNWISPKVCANWFEGSNVPRCLRPEQLQITATSQTKETPITVRSVRFRGSHEEVALHHTDTDETVTFWHRPSAPTLTEGKTVALSLRQPT